MLYKGSHAVSSFRYWVRICSIPHNLPVKKNVVSLACFEQQLGSELEQFSQF